MVLFCSFEATFSHYPTLAFFGGGFSPALSPPPTPPTPQSAFIVWSSAAKHQKKAKKNKKTPEKKATFWRLFPTLCLHFPSRLRCWGRGGGRNGANKGHFLEFCRFLPFFHPRFALNLEARGTHSNRLHFVGKRANASDQAATGSGGGLSGCNRKRLRPALPEATLSAAAQPPPSPLSPPTRGSAPRCARRFVFKIFPFPHANDLPL